MFKIYRPISALLLVASLGSAWNAFASEGTIGETSEVNQQSGKVTGIVADDLRNHNRQRWKIRPEWSQKRRNNTNFISGLYDTGNRL